MLFTEFRRGGWDREVGNLAVEPWASPFPFQALQPYLWTKLPGPSPSQWPSLTSPLLWWSKMPAAPPTSPSHVLGAHLRPHTHQVKGWRLLKAKNLIHLRSAQHHGKRAQKSHSPQPTAIFVTRLCLHSPLGETFTINPRDPMFLQTLSPSGAVKLPKQQTRPLESHLQSPNNINF